MRIAFVGNPEAVHFRRWIEEFERRGHECRAYTAPQLAGALDGTVPIGWSKLPGPPGLLLRVVDLRRKLRAFRPDVVHAHGAYNYGAWAALAGFRPLVLTVWGSDVLVAPRLGRLSRWKVRLALRSADVITGDSLDLLEVAVSLGAHPRACEHVVFGVDVDKFAPPRNRPVNDPPVVLSTRRLEPLYRIADIIDAVGILVADGYAVRLRVASYGTEEEALRRRAAQVAPGAVEFLGRLTDAELLAEYQCADVFATVPSSDGTSVSLLEAMACALPIVATDLPANGQWLTDDTSALVPVGDPAKIAAGIARFVGDQVARRSAGEQNRAKVVAEGSWARQMDRMERLYRDAAERRLP